MNRIACAGAIVHDAQGRLLLVRRLHDPARDTWSLPGGRVEPGETAREACAREVREETGLVVDVGRLVGTVERPAATSVYVIDDFACRVVGGDLKAGSDAREARWVDATELSTLTCAPLLLQTLTGWEVLPR